MARGPKSAKSKVEARLPVTRKSPKGDGARVRDLENRLAEALRDKAEAQEQLQIRDRELAETRERETTTGATLRVISSAPGDLEQVFHTLLVNAARLCEAQLALLFRYEAGLFQLMGHHGDTRSADFAATAFPRDPFTASPSIGLGRIAHELRPVQIADLTQDSAYTEREPLRVVTVEIGGCRTWLGVPMLKDGHLVGAFVLWRREVQPFTDRQIGLVSTFADQAAIAIENVRLFSETKEALERQTATAEILRVISSSPTDIQRVFETIAEAALRFFGAWGVLVFRYDEGLARLAAVRGGQPGSAEALLERSVPSPPVKGTFLGETILRRTAQQIVDVETDTVFGPALRANARERGWRSGCQVPMLRGSDVLGVIAVSRTEPGPFSSDDIALLRTFADQAVIAIENVRLFKELQEKNRALTEAHAQVSESLEQQTATAEILRVISSSPTDIQPVLDAVAENAAHICAAADAHIRLIEGDTLRAVARFGTAPFRVPDVIPLNRDFPAGRSIIERRTIHIEDVATLGETDFPKIYRETRSLLVTPLVREGVPLGAILVRRVERRAFTERQIELLKTFADQAVIAIENVRLFTELEARNRDLTTALDQQTATSDILKVISSSPTDVQPVFDAIVGAAVRLCHAIQSNVQLFDGQL